MHNLNKLGGNFHKRKLTNEEMYRLFINNRKVAVESLDEMFLVSRIRNELEWWVETPTHIPLLLYGIGGNGKTTVAKLLSQMFCNPDDILYRDFSLETKNREEREIVEKFILCSDGVLHFGDESEPISDIENFIILDEFHNIGKTANSIKGNADMFKGILCPDFLEQTKSRVVVCANTTSNNPLSKILSQPIMSRCNELCFNLGADEYDEWVSLVKSKYPDADERVIRNSQSDFRSLKIYLSKLEYRSSK